MTTWDKPIYIPIYNVNNVFFKFSRIPDGEYKNDKINLKITSPNKDYKRIEIESIDFYFLIRFFDYGYDVVYQNKIDINLQNNSYSLNIVKALGTESEFIKIKHDNKNFTIFKDLIRIEDKEYKIKDNIITKIIDKNCFIEYDYEKNKLYTHISTKPTPISKKDYIKFESDLESLIRNLDTITSHLKRNNWEEYIEFLPLNKLNNLSINELNVLKQELIEIADIYTTYENRLNIDNKHLDEIGLFANYLSEKPLEARINKLSNHILNCNMEDTNELKYIKNEINLILKEKKKVKTKKLKNN